MGDQMTVTEVARATRVQRGTVLRWIHKGQLPATKLPGGQYRIRREDLPRPEATR